MDVPVDALLYNPGTGALTWSKTRGRIIAGTVAGSKDADGYVYVRLNYKLYAAHRLAWRIHYGRWPEGIIDHINRDPSDNRIANLREANASQNQANRGLNNNNTSGFRGVAWRPNRNRWTANIRIDGKVKLLGLFKTPEEAASAYAQAAQAHFGEFYAGEM